MHMSCLWPNEKFYILKHNKLLLARKIFNNSADALSRLLSSSAASCLCVD